MNLSLRTGLPRLGTLADRVRAFTRPAHINEATAAALLDRYDLVALSPPRNIGSGWRSHIVTVETDRGGKVLKRYPARWTLASVEHEHAVYFDQVVELVGGFFGGAQARIDAMVERSLEVAPHLWHRPR